MKAKPKYEELEQRIKELETEAMEQKRTGDALKQSEDMYQMLIDNSREAIFVVQDGALKFMNAVAIQLTGISTDSSSNGQLNKTYIEWLHTDDREKVAENYLKRIRGEKVPSEYDIRVIDKDKNLRWVTLRSSKIMWKGRSATLNFMADITKRKEVEEALRKSEMRFRDFLENLGDAAYEADSSGNVTYANKMSEIITGMPLKDIIKKPFLPLFSKESQEIAIDVYQRTLNGESPEYELTFINGKVCHFKNRPLRDQKDNIVGVCGIARDITERKRVEADLRQSEEKYRLLIDSADNPITVFDRDGRLILINISGAKNLCALPKDLVGKSMHELFPDMADFLVERNRQVIEKGSALYFEDLVELPSGKRWFWSNLQPVKSPDGKTHAVQIISYDITERRLVEEALHKAKDELEHRVAARTADLNSANKELQREIEERTRMENTLIMTKARLQYLLDVSPAVIYSCKPAGDYGNTYMSENIRDQLGYDPHEFTDNPRFWSEHIHPDDAHRVFEKLPQVFARGYHRQEYRFLHKDGNYRWMHDELRLVRDENDKPLEIVGCWRDITDFKKAEEKIRKSEEKYRTILETMAEGYYEVNLAGNFTFFNDSMCRILGYSKQELMGMNNREFMDQENARKVYEVFNNVYFTGKPDKGTDWLLIKKDGGERHIEASVSLMRDADGLAVGFRGVARDITKRKEAEKALRKSESKYRLLAENMSDIVWSLDLKGRLTYISPSIKNTLGYTQEEVMHLSLDGLFTPAFRELVNKVMREMIKKEKLGQPDGLPKKLELEYICKDGSTLWAELVGTVLRDQDGNMIGFTGMTRDITDRKQAEKELKESEETARALINAPPDSALLIDSEGIVLDINETAAQRLLTTVDAIKGKCVWDFLPPDVAESRKKRVEQVISTGSPVHFEDMRFGRYMRNIGYPVFDSMGRVTRLALYSFDITDQKRTEEALKTREDELMIKNKTLEETNIALKVLLQKRKGYKDELEEKVLSNVRELVTPYIKRLKRNLSDETSKTYLNILESNLNDIISPFLQRLSINKANLTHAQIQVANLIREGKTTKEIADLLSISEKTIQDHRKNIRKKLRIINKKVNLKSYLMGFEETGSS